MNYIIDNKDRIIINEQVIFKTFKGYINGLCIDSFSTLKGRTQAIKKQLNIKYNVPVFINEKNILFKVKQNDMNYYINYYEILDIDKQKEKTVIVFKDLEVLRLDISKRIIKSRLEVCKRIEERIRE